MENVLNISDISPPLKTALVLFVAGLKTRISSPSVIQIVDSIMLQENVYTVSPDIEGKRFSSIEFKAKDKGASLLNMLLYEICLHP